MKKNEKIIDANLCEFCSEDIMEVRKARNNRRVWIDGTMILMFVSASVLSLVMSIVLVVIILEEL